MTEIISKEPTMFRFADSKKTKLKFLYSACLIFLLLMSAKPLIAQVSRFTGWGAVINSIKINSKVNFIFDAQIRSTDDWANTETTIIRPGISYSTGKATSLSVGLALIQNLKSLGGVNDRVADNRLWQQFIFNQPIGLNLLQHRIRLEERTIATLFAEGNELKKKNRKFNARFRYFNRYIAAFNRGEKLSKGPYWAIQNEFFFNVAGLSSVNKKLFDQSRTYIGAGWRLSSKSDLELGYMLQHIEGKGEGYTNNHILQLSTFLRL
jgi:hypothetical protein